MAKFVHYTYDLGRPSIPRLTCSVQPNSRDDAASLTENLSWTAAVIVWRTLLTLQFSKQWTISDAAAADLWTDTFTGLG